MEISKIYNEDCLITMSKMPNEFVDLTITSPPYDGLRNYNGYSFDFEIIIYVNFCINNNNNNHFIYLYVLFPPMEIELSDK